MRHSYDPQMPEGNIMYRTARSASSCVGSFLSYQWLKFGTLWLLLCPCLPKTKTLTASSSKFSVVEIHLCFVGIIHDSAHYQPQLTPCDSPKPFLIRNKSGQSSPRLLRKLRRTHTARPSETKQAKIQAFCALPDLFGP